MDGGGDDLAATKKMRMTGSGHGGVEAKKKLDCGTSKLLTEVQKFREAMADTWSEVQLIDALHCRPRRGVFDNEVAILMGSNSEFLKETRPMSTWLDVERLTYREKIQDACLSSFLSFRLGRRHNLGQECLLLLQPLGARRRTFRFVSSSLTPTGIDGSIQPGNRDHQLLNTALT